MYKLSCLATAALAASVTRHVAALATTVNATAQTSAAVAPKLDPWYTAPSGFESATPGAVLRTRSAPANLAGTIANCGAAYNILYRTSDSSDQPTWAVTTLLVPLNATSASGIPDAGLLLSYQTPYDSANLDESPSYTLHSSQPSDISNALARGWYVNIPDYEGPLASYTAGGISGRATLDSIRAARSSSLGLPKSGRNAMWGYSGGALAAEWAAELQPSYAPDLVVSGAALGGLTPNITSVLLSVSGTESAALAIEGMVGFVSQHIAARAALQADFKSSGPYTMQNFYAVQNITLVEAEVNYAYTDVFSYFDNGLGIMQNSDIQSALEEDGIMGIHGVPTIPIYAYKAIKDEISNIADTDRLVQKLCASGAYIVYDRNTVGGHQDEQINGDASAVQFLTQVLEGNYTTAAGCSTRNVTVSISTTGA